MTTGRRLPAVLHDPRRIATPGVFAALAVVYLVWGSTYVALRVAVRALPPLTLSGVRFLVAGVLIYAWCAWRRRRRPGRWQRPTLRHWRVCAVLGLALPAAGTGGATWAEQRLPSGTTALLLAGIPLWMTLAGRIVDREPVRPTAAVGLLLGVVGVGVLVDPFAGGAPDPVSTVVALCGAACWGCGSVYARHAAKPVQPLVGSGMEMICAGVAALGLGAATGEFTRIDWTAAVLPSLLALGYLVMFGSLLAYSSYEWLVRSAPGQLVGTYAFVNPLVAVLLGWLLLDERITLRIGLAAGVIVLGVALIVSRATGSTGGTTRDHARYGAQQHVITRREEAVVDHDAWGGHTGRGREEPRCPSRR
jgi:drug/metabolite transporter (DMT)-like permease